MDIERELELLINKHKGKQVGLGEIRLDWFAEDCLKEIRRLKSAIATLQAYQPVAIFKTETTSCEWCSGELVDPSPYILLAIEGCELEVSLDHQDVGWYSDSFKIKFCPNCGRKLDWSEE